jgi:hypothetical protein
MNPPGRYRFPDGDRNTTALVVILATVAAAVAVFATVAAISLWFRLDGLASDNADALRVTYDSRRAASYEGCVQREQLKADLRLVLRRFRVNPADLPRSHGMTVLSPLPEGCQAYTDRTVPEASRP